MPAKLINLEGQQFGYWKVLKRDTETKGTYWICECQKCNKTVKSVRGSRLRSGESKSCGCQPAFNDLTAQKFGRLTVISREQTHKKPGGGRVIMWKCQCECGSTLIVSGDNLKSGHTQSCGCLQIEKMREKCFNDLTNQVFGNWTVIEQAPTQHKTTMWKCKCKCGTVSNVSASNLIKGKSLSCGCLTRSVGELNIIKILEKENINFIPQYNNFEDLNTRLKYDFYLPDYNRLIEFDGAQHFDIVPHGFFTQEDLNNIKKRDYIKNNYALSHNIPLVRIPYWERDTITLDLILGDKYLIQNEDEE